MALPFSWVQALLAEKRPRLPRESLVETRLEDQGAPRDLDSGIEACGREVFEWSGYYLKSDKEELAYALLIGAMTMQYMYVRVK